MSGMFHSLGTICSFLLKGKVKRGGGHGTMSPGLLVNDHVMSMSLVNDQIKTVVEGLVRVCIPPA